MNSIKWIWSYIKKYKVKYAIAMLLVLSISLINLVNPFIAGNIVDKVLNGGQTEILIPLIGVMIAVVLIKAVVTYSFQMIFEIVSQKVLFKIREDLYEKLLVLDGGFYSKTKTGDIMARMTGDTDAIRHFVAWVAYNILSSGTLFIFAIISMFTIDFRLTLAMLAIAPIIGVLAYKLGKDIGPTFQGIREGYSRLNSVVQENISGNRIVRAFGREDFEIEKFDVENRNYKEKNLKTIEVASKYLPIIEFLSSSLSVIMVLVGGLLVINKYMTLGNLVTFNSLLWAINMPMKMAGHLINDSQRFIASSEKIIELLETEESIKNKENPKKIDKLKGDVRFENVSLDLDGRRVLNNVSFEVKNGQTIGLVGHTGSGKSLIINLLTRFYDPTEGNIYIDNINIKDIDLALLRGSISTAMQDIFLFSDTVNENIAFAKTDATEEEIRNTAKMAQAEDFIERLEDKYETIIGERGVGLSGGQKQRLSLARAMIKDVPIFILDDVTSAVDMETEKKIQEELKTIKDKKTNFIIAHRISSLKHSDIILVLNEGEVIERGSHEELLEMKGYYYRIFETQYGDFSKEKEVV